MTLILSGTEGLSDIDGSAATPAIRGTDANTGIFFPAADTIGFSEGGVECARFNADAQFVAAAGTAALPVITTTGDVNTGIFFPAADTIAFAEGGVESMRIDSSGRFFLNTTSSPTVNGLSTGGIGMLVATGGDAFNMKHESNGSTMFNLWQTGTSSFTALAFYKGNTQTGVGGINCTTTATSYATSSDYRLKEAIAPMTGALDKVALLKPVTYKWKSDGSDSQGFIAHELQAVVPECVVGEKDAVDSDGNPQYQGIDTSFLVATLTAAIQELKAIVDTQAARITALEAA